MTCTDHRSVNNRIDQSGATERHCSTVASCGWHFRGADDYECAVAWVICLLCFSLHEQIPRRYCTAMWEAHL
jgi:hypothetical protein